MKEQFTELAKNMDKSFAIDGSDESWSIYVDALGNGQFLVTLLLRKNYEEYRAIADDANELGEVIADMLYSNRLE